MSSTHWQATFLCALLAVACGPSGGGSGSSYCKTSCDVLAELCEGDEFEGDSCIDECKEDTIDKSVTSKAESKKCFKNAPTCEVAQSCASLLEDAPDDPTGGGASSGGGVGIGTGGGTGGGGPSSKLAEAICQRSSECQGGSDLTLNQCISAISVFLDPLVSIIKSGAADCVANASCEDLEKNNEEIMTVCTGVNPDNGTCVGPTTLKVCNSSGACANVDCKKLCSAVDSESEGTCEVSEFTGKTNCLCESSTEFESTENSSSEGGSSTPSPDPEPSAIP
jgi:hypothetical protein